MLKKESFHSLTEKMSKNPKVAAGVGAAVVLVAFFALNSIFHFTGGYGAFIDSIIAKNIKARGGVDSWSKVSTLRLSGQMDLGKGLHVPYTLEQKRPGKMCLEFLFNKQTATQCVNGKTGWKVLPFQGRNAPEPMTKKDLAGYVGMTEIDGLLSSSEKMGNDISYEGKTKTDNGHNLLKLELTLPTGAKRWLYIDEETGLETKMELTRLHRGKEELVETSFSDWRNKDGLLIPFRQETKAKSDKKSHFVTIESVQVNPPIDDARFKMPVKRIKKATTATGNKAS